MAKKSVTNMVNAKRHNGFSLIEVLFAVMVLTMGLIFTASQFPIGLMTSRQVTETTLHAVESRNAEVMTRLQMGQMGVFIGNNSSDFIQNDIPPTPPPPYPTQNVHYLCQANLRVSDGAIVMDDPTDNIFSIDPVPADVYIKDASPGKDHLPPHIKDHKHDTEPADAAGYLAPENIGQIVMPQVNGYDREVLIGMENLGYTLPNDMPFDNPTTAPAQLQKYDDWQDVILNIALERSYSQALFYKKIGDGASDYRYRVFIFTLSNTNKDARYPIQIIGASRGYNIGEAAPESDETDRQFPFPWRVAFTDPYDLNTDPVTDRIKLMDYNDSTNLPLLLDILRTGGYIIDTDPEDRVATAHDDNGYLYKILDIELDDEENYWLRLDRELQDSLQWFWIFPPAIIRGEGFAETQPVVNVTETTISF